MKGDANQKGLKDLSTYYLWQKKLRCKGPNRGPGGGGDSFSLKQLMRDQKKRKDSTEISEQKGKSQKTSPGAPRAQPGAFGLRILAAVGPKRGKKRLLDFPRNKISGGTEHKGHSKGPRKRGLDHQELGSMWGLGGKKEKGS